MQLEHNTISTSKVLSGIHKTGKPKTFNIGKGNIPDQQLSANNKKLVDLIGHSHSVPEK